MPAATLQTEAFVLARHPGTGAFERATLLSAEHGILTAFVRISTRKGAGRPALDLFSEAAVRLESTNQGRTWFLREARLIASGEALGRSYEALRAASALAALIARNPPPPDEAGQASALFRAALGALASPGPAPVVLFKSFFRFARDHGYPVREQWLPALPQDLRAAAERLLRTPLAGLADAGADPGEVALLQTRLEEYLRGSTDLLVG